MSLVARNVIRPEASDLLLIDPITFECRSDLLEAGEASSLEWGGKATCQSLD
jgi:hypothetical protein